MNKNGITPIMSGPKPFSFETMWVGEEDCKNIIKQVWQQGACDGSVEDLMGHIFDCGSRLKQWNKSCFGHV